VVEALRASALREDERAVGEIVKGTDVPKPLAMAALMHLLCNQVLVFDISQKLDSNTVLRVPR
jgi:hypothetical protein